MLRDLGLAAVFLAGLATAVLTAASALRTVVLPRAVPAKLARSVFQFVRLLFRLRLKRASSYEVRDAVMASYAPLSLLALLGVWLALVWAGYGLMLWALHPTSLWSALALSGSSLLTLGFVPPATRPLTLAAFTEAGVGLVLLALLITYLPSLYTAFSRRELQVTKLEVRAGSPPTGVEMLTRAWVLERLDKLPEVWRDWEDWFVDVEETHTTFPALTYFRSPQPDKSWVTAAGAVLDAASLQASSIDVPRDVEMELCIRAGYLALRRIAAFFRIPYPADPRPDDPISVSREEYEEVLDRMAAGGVALHPDRDRAWRDFAGWRVNYDAVLVALAALTMAPYAPWSSDRSLAHTPRPRLRRLRETSRVGG